MFTSSSSSNPSAQIAEDEESAAATIFNSTLNLSLIMSFFNEIALATP